MSVLTIFHVYSFIKYSGLYLRYLSTEHEVAVIRGLRESMGREGGSGKTKLKIRGTSNTHKVFSPKTFSKYRYYMSHVNRRPLKRIFRSFVVLGT
jgi:hypothetical protein